MAAPEGKGTAPGRLRGVTAGNASPMTGPGTTTWIVGSGRVAVIDPGPDDPAHLTAILAALDPDEEVSAILVTHPHLDHSALAPGLAAATGAPVLGYGPAGSGRSPRMQALAQAGLTGGEGVDHAFRPDLHLRHGETLRGPDWALTAWHTPGHMAEHLCFAWEDLLFSGDLVMGWAPSLVSPPDGDMGAYLASLARLAETPWRRLLPTHGAPVENPAARLAELAAHRRDRETQILAALAAGASTLPEIVATVYRDTPPHLHPAATRNALAHLIDLEERTRISAFPSPTPEARFLLH